MIQTNNFKTRSIYEKKDNIGVDKYWLLACDYGFSGVKGYSKNSYYCFPSFAKECPKSVVDVSIASDKDIKYRDKNGKEWFIGESATNLVDSMGTNDSEEVTFGRMRYFSPEFKAISEVGLALGMRENVFGSPKGKKLLLQTGLPPKYKDGDTDFLKKALAGIHSFDIKLGTRDWEHFEFELDENNIFVMDQPLGSLFSACVDVNGRFTQDAQKYLNSTVQIWDFGFKTFDIETIIHGKIMPNTSQTFDELGMKQVFAKTAEAIENKYKGTKVPVSAFQKKLESGKTSVIQMVTEDGIEVPKSRKIYFGDILEQCSKDICVKAFNEAKRICNYFADTDIVIGTGGTGAAWFSILSEKFKDEDVDFIGANRNEKLPHIFSNVRGYYMYLYMMALRM